MNFTKFPIQSASTALKQLFIKIQLSTFIISANFKILQFLNKDVVWALKGAKFIILSAFFGE